ncbi:MAG: hypothetical protein ABI665_12085 [Vicinamibacterales bacterium]
MGNMVSVSVFFQSERLPTAPAWQLAIEQAGFPLQLDSNLDLATLMGIIPAQFAGEPTGFEYFLETDADIPDGFPPGAEGRALHTCVSLVSRSTVEGLAAVAAAAALALVTSGVLYDDAEGRAYEPQDGLAWARQIIADGKR